MENKKEKKFNIKLIVFLIVMCISILLLIIYIYNTASTDTNVNTADYNSHFTEKDATKYYETLYINENNDAYNVKHLLDFASFYNKYSGYTPTSITYPEEQIFKLTDSKKIYELQLKIQKDLKYNVSCNYSDDGIINKIMIEAVK